jgi:hypothetical protein
MYIASFQLRQLFERLIPFRRQVKTYYFMSIKSRQFSFLYPDDGSRIILRNAALEVIKSNGNVISVPN